MPHPHRSSDMAATSTPYHRTGGHIPPVTAATGSAAASEVKPRVCAPPAQDQLKLGLIDQVAELVAAGDAQLRVGTVEVRGDGVRGQEEPVGDLAVGQAAAGQ